MTQQRVSIYFIKVVRNSVEVQQVMDNQHKWNKTARVSGNWVTARMWFGEMKPGHSIRSAPVLYHKLRVGSSTSSQTQFVLEMLEKEFNLLFGKDTSLKWSDVAILYEKMDDESLQHNVKEMLLQKFNIKTHSIEESIKTCEQGTLVFDCYSNAMSFEVACVVFLCQMSSMVPYYGSFVVASRARARLVFIDYDVTSPPFPFIDNSITLASWEENQGVFETV